MKTIIFLALLSTTVLAQSQWQPPRSMLVSRPDEQRAAAKHLKLPANGIILLATLDCSDCKRPLEALRGNKSATILIRARPASVERWKQMKPTAARIITINTDEEDADWFGLGVFGLPLILHMENGNITGVSDHVPPKL